MKPHLKKYQDSPDARKKLFEFYCRVYPAMPEMVNHDRFQWQSFENPVEDAAERPLIWYLLSDDGKIVGHNSIFKYPMKIDRRDYHGYCSTNLIVEPGTEGRGLGHILIENNEMLDGVPFAYGPTPASLSAFQKRGWIPLYDARMYTLILRPFRSLRFLKKPAWQALMLSPVLKLLSWIFRFYKAATVPGELPGVSFQTVKKFEPEWDIYWEKYLESFGLYYRQESHFLNYKYAARRDVKHNIIIFEKNNCPVGYIVFRTSASKTKMARLGRIVELVCDPAEGEDLAAYMINVAAARLLQDKVDSIVGIASSPELKKAYRRNGMIFSRTQIMLVKETDFRISELRPKFANIWHLSLGDADIDNYW